jgi:hypothetical protein
MDYLNWELSVLSRAVAYTNLSGAASHVGLSQPQLSRIVAKLESQLELTLLDREARRRSAWTPSAYRLAEVYNDSLRQFRSGLSKLTENAELSHVRIGTLEGLTGNALELARHLFEGGSVRVLELDVLDLNDLEERFGKREFDLIFTFREPGRKKFKHVRKLGYQTLESLGSPKGVQVMSSFEFGNKMGNLRSDSARRILVSNSLEVRKTWIAQFGGTGILPSQVRKEKGAKAGDVPVLIVGAEDLGSAFWKKVQG